jgi:hypothetical protein
MSDTDILSTGEPSRAWVPLFCAAISSGSSLSLSPRPLSWTGGNPLSRSCCAKGYFDTPVMTEALSHSHGSCQILAPPTLLRYVVGVSPQNWVNDRVNELRLSKPTADDVACTDCPGVASSAIARSIRACRR